MYDMTEIEGEIGYLFARELPKVELHAHLNGSLTKQSLIKLEGCLRSCIADYEHICKPPPTDRTPQDCSKHLEEAHKCLKTPKNVYKATQSVIKDFVKDNVVYLELQTTPKSEDGMSKQEYIESVVRGIQESEFKTLITVKLILSIDRTHSREESNDNLNIIVKMRDKFPDVIKGISLTGDPEQGLFDESLFREARSSGLYTTIPCGEIVNNLEVERILRFRPDRVSHCTTIHPLQGGSCDNFERYLTEEIPMEYCLTSYVINDRLKSYKENPLRSWTVEQPLAICTGNKGAFGTTLSQEYALFQHYYNLKPTELWQVALNPVWSSFASEEEKFKIDRILNNWFLNYSASLKLDAPLEFGRHAERRRLDIVTYHI